MNETCTHCRLWNRPLSHHTKNNDVNISQTIYCLRVTFKYEMHYATDKMMHVSQTKPSQHKHAGIRWNFTKSTTSYRERSPRASNNFIQIMKIKQQQQHARLSTTSPSALEAMISFYDGNRVLWHRNIKRKECSHYSSQKASKIFTLAKKKYSLHSKLRVRIYLPANVDWLILFFTFSLMFSVTWSLLPHIYFTTLSVSFVCFPSLLHAHSSVLCQS